MTNPDELGALLAKYADVLQMIYDEHTAGDYTFTGVLSSFLRELDQMDHPVPDDPPFPAPPPLYYPPGVRHPEVH
jgi:hypothetical protein